MTIPEVPSTIITSLSGKVPFDVRNVIEEGPFGILENRSVIAVRTGLSNRMILDMAPCPDRPAMDLPAIDGWTA